MFFIKAGGIYSDCPLKGCHCHCEACIEKVLGRLKALLPETTEILLPLLMILQNNIIEWVWIYTNTVTGDST